VWHAFWTFSMQFAFLCEALVEDGVRLKQIDPDILDFLAEMQARIELCSESLEAFEVLEEAERTKVELGLSIVERTALDLGHEDAEYNRRSQHWSNLVCDEVQAWSSRGVDVTGPA
jgi:hypothetical protein